MESPEGSKVLCTCAAAHSQTFPSKPTALRTDTLGSLEPRRSSTSVRSTGLFISAGMGAWPVSHLNRSGFSMSIISWNCCSLTLSSFCKFAAACECAEKQTKRRARWAAALMITNCAWWQGAHPVAKHDVHLEPTYQERTVEEHPVRGCVAWGRSLHVYGIRAALAHPAACSDKAAAVGACHRPQTGAIEPGPADSPSAFARPGAHLQGSALRIGPPSGGRA